MYIQIGHTFVSSRYDLVHLNQNHDRKNEIFRQLWIMCYLWLFKAVQCEALAIILSFIFAKILTRIPIQSPSSKTKNKLSYIAQKDWIISHKHGNVSLWRSSWHGNISALLTLCQGKLPVKGGLLAWTESNCWCFLCCYVSLKEKLIEEFRCLGLQLRRNLMQKLSLRIFWHRICYAITIIWATVRCQRILGMIFSIKYFRSCCMLYSCQALRRT